MTFGLVALSLLSLCATICFIFWVALPFVARFRHSNRHPPIVQIPVEEQFHHTRIAYERALKEHGPIIGVYRKNRLEIIVAKEYFHDVLTREDLFSFEEGTLAMLNFHPLLYLNRRLFQDLDRLVRESISPNLERILEDVTPILEAGVGKMLGDSLSGGRPVPVEFTQAVRSMMAEVMLRVVFGEPYTTSADLANIDRVVEALATLSGLYQNQNYWTRTFATTARVLTWVRVVLFDLPLYFGPIAWRLWKDVRSFSLEGENRHMKQGTLVHFMSVKYAKMRPNGRVPYDDAVWMMVLSLALVFASVHLTSTIATWVLFQLAKRPDCINIIREEMRGFVEVDNTNTISVKSSANFGTSALLNRHKSPGKCITVSTGPVTQIREETLNQRRKCALARIQIPYTSLNSAVYLDAFVREALRTKGDTLAVIRRTTRDVPLGGYVIPRGTFVYPLATLAHFSREEHGEDAEEFKPERWAEFVDAYKDESNKDRPSVNHPALGQRGHWVCGGKRAITGGTGYWPFGLGRFACPGRAFAVAEIKLILLHLLARATPTLEDNSFEVIDPQNITAVPPVGRLYLTPWTD